jgi:hypothetical protein
MRTGSNAVEALLTTIEQQPLSRSLVTVLRTAGEIGDDGFAAWVKLELMGYLSGNAAMTKDVIVPEYRAVSGLWYDDFGRPLVIDDPTLDFVNEIRLRYGAAELEGAASATDVLSMRENKLAEIIQQNLGATVTVFRFQSASVRQVLTNIKLHLIDHVTGRRDKINCLAAADSIAQAPEPDILQIRPNLYGIGLDLRALWRKMFGSHE